MSDLVAISGARIFDGHDWHDDAALLVEFGHVAGIVPSNAVPANAETVHLDGGMVVPGFIDLQVNGGAGILFNNEPTVEAIRAICAVHAQFGTTGTPAHARHRHGRGQHRPAIAAGKAADRAKRCPAFHRPPPRRPAPLAGAQGRRTIRRSSARWTDATLDASHRRPRDLPNLLVHPRAETVPPARIAQLAAAGIAVSIGHSDAGTTTPPPPPPSHRAPPSSRTCSMP
jgi:N-acetylglucosamine-6-phosphate deacetylase